MLAAVRLATGSQRCFAAPKCASAAVQAKLHGSSRDSGVQPQQEFEYGPSGPEKEKNICKRNTCGAAARVRAERACGHGGRLLEHKEQVAVLAPRRRRGAVAVPVHSRAP